MTEPDAAARPEASWELPSSAAALPRAPRSPRWFEAALVAVKLGVSALVLARGFYAISDDDFSRVVIAQGFAVAPRLDPSGTSWLPLPFWLTGTAMAVFGRSLEVARAVGLVCGVVSVLSVYRAALWMGAAPRAAFVAALAAAVLPVSAVLGASFQPEALAAGLVVLGAAGSTGSRPIVGAAALFAACLCRYEAWPAAAMFAALAAMDARNPMNAQRGRFTVAAIVAAAAPLAWVLHGVFVHGDALFFVHRVAAYRRALGDTTSLAALRPEAWLFLVTLGVTFGGARRIAALRRAWAVLAAVLLFLLAGVLTGATPTHHPERTLLPAWFVVLAIGAAALGERKSGEARTAREVPLLVLAAVLAAFLVFRRETYPDRATERDVGALAASHLDAANVLAVDTPDYGYFAVMAAFGAPERAIAVASHDPRDPSRESPFADETALRQRLDALGATWVVAARPHWPVAFRLGPPVATRADLALLHVAARRAPGAR